MQPWLLFTTTLARVLSSVPGKALVSAFVHAFVSALVSSLVGLLSTLFVWSLNWVTQTRIDHSECLWLLPFAGVLIYFIYNFFGKNLHDGMKLILHENTHWKIAPLIWSTTLITHLFGGSAGRESTSVQIGAAVATSWNQIFKKYPIDPRLLIRVGISAGFASVIGSPLAGFFFSQELFFDRGLKKFKFEFILECLVAAFIGYTVTRLLGLHHMIFPQVNSIFYSPQLVFSILASGILFGLTARVYLTALTHLKKKFSYLSEISKPYVSYFLGGILILISFYAVGNTHSAGLGLNFITNASHEIVSLEISITKFYFTLLTISSGFKGGEFIPMVFIGSTLGSALGAYLPVSFKMLHALGFGSVFAGVSKAPIACSFIICDLFGYSLFPLALSSCFLSYYCSGEKSVYKL